MEQILFTVAEVATILKTNKTYVYSLINSGLLPALKLGSLKIRRTSLEEFLKNYDGMDLTDITDIKQLL
jgi:excisionase family DNA binding protein